MSRNEGKDFDSEKKGEKSRDGTRMRERKQIFTCVRKGAKAFPVTVRRTFMN